MGDVPVKDSSERRKRERTRGGEVTLIGNIHGKRRNKSSICIINNIQRADRRGLFTARGGLRAKKSKIEMTALLNEFNSKIRGDSKSRGESREYLNFINIWLIEMTE